jgi:phosphoglucosamine mutase
LLVIADLIDQINISSTTHLRIRPTVLQLLAIMKKRRKPLSELATVMENFPQVLKNVRTSSQIDVHHIPDFAATVRGMEQKLGDTGRILVRPSGTESLIRVMIEGQD